jgi:magnesium transporter
LITYYVHRGGQTAKVGEIDRAWLTPGSGVVVWADVSEPDTDDARVLRDVFKIHPLAVEDALQELQFPKIETYPNFLYVVLHGIDFQPDRHSFVTQDVDFFLSRVFLVTAHDGKRRSVSEVTEQCTKNEAILAEGAVALMQRIVHNMVDHYRPEVDELEERLDGIEMQVLEHDHENLTGEILGVKRDISSMRRVVIPQRDIVGRLARREFEIIDQEMAFRFRDVYDHLVRLADESIIFQDRVTGILDAHLASVSNRLAMVSKVLAALAVIFGPLTVLTGLFGMNVRLPQFPGGENAQFWWISGIMGAITLCAYAVFKHQEWL